MQYYSTKQSTKLTSITRPQNPNSFSTLYSSNEVDDSDSAENDKHNSNNDPLFSPSPDSELLSSNTYPKRDTKVVEVQIVDFEFRPKKVNMIANSTVKWTVGENKTSHLSGIYSSENRSFVISICELDVESDLLAKGQSFEYTFDEPGTYNIVCLSYPRMKSIVVVSEAGIDFKKVEQEEFKKRGLLQNYREIEDYLQQKKASETLNEKQAKDTSSDAFSTAIDLKALRQLKLEEELKRLEEETQNMMEKANQIEADQIPDLASELQYSSISSKQTRSEESNVLTNNDNNNLDDIVRTGLEFRIEGIYDEVSKPELNEKPPVSKGIAQYEEQKFAEPSRESTQEIVKPSNHEAVEIKNDKENHVETKNGSQTNNDKANEERHFRRLESTEEKLLIEKQESGMQESQKVGKKNKKKQKGKKKRNNDVVKQMDENKLNGIAVSLSKGSKQEIYTQSEFNSAKINNYIEQLNQKLSEKPKEEGNGREIMQKGKNERASLSDNRSNTREIGINDSEKENKSFSEKVKKEEANKLNAKQKGYKEQYTAEAKMRRVEDTQKAANRENLVSKPIQKEEQKSIVLNNSDFFVSLKEAASSYIRSNNPRLFKINEKSKAFKEEDSSEEMEKIAFLKAFLTNRFEYAEMFNCRELYVRIKDLERSRKT